MIRIRRRPAMGDEIPTASMSDIAFLLLIFFIVSTIFHQEQGLPLLLPGRASRTVRLSPQNILGIEVIGVIPESPGVLTASNAGIPVILDEASDAGQAYADAVARLCGEERPMRFIDAQKKGLLARIFGS